MPAYFDCMTTTPEPATIPIPALLRAARGSYMHAIRRRLVAAGFADLPRNGAYVLGGVHNQGGAVESLVRELGVSKQATSQLIESLVTLGYLNRAEHPSDRRRIVLSLTDRGKAAAEVVRTGVLAVDDELAGMLTVEQLADLRAGLVALCDIRERLEEEAKAGL